ncbi:MAG: secretin N-terminal domain-containing protein [Kiritimatiellae bacterium]|nr:secretin N-terminal domain-containing protein [Kiritimatiellia bacterium]
MNKVFIIWLSIFFSLLGYFAPITCAQESVVEQPAVPSTVPVSSQPAAIEAVQPAEVQKPLSSDSLRVMPKRLKDYDLPGLQQKVYLKSVTSWDIAQLIDILAREGKLSNIVVGPNVKGTTKLQFEGVTVGDALEVILAVNNLAYEIKGGIIKIITDDDYKLLNGASFYDTKQIKVVELKHSSAERVGKMLDKVKSTTGTIVFDQVSNTLILIDMPDKLMEMVAIIEKADISSNTETKTFILQYANVEDVQKELTTLLTKEVGFVRIDKRTKTLMVTDLPQNIQKVEQVVKAFDMRSKQVFIEAKVVEVTLNDNFALGINWQHMFQGLDPRFSLQSVSLPGAPTTPVGTLTYNTIVSGGDLQVVVDALKQVGETKILSSPHIAVTDGQEATIKVIENQPYKETKLESGTTNITGVTYQFIPVGVTLSVTPKINDENMITVMVKPDISSISQWYDGDAQQGTPVVKSATATTSVMVKDGVTVIIGGMIKDRKDTSVNSIPFLGGIPLLGRLFRYDSVSVVNTETIVFMTPRIITGEEPYLRTKDMKKSPKPLRPVGPAGEKTLKPVR